MNLTAVFISISNLSPRTKHISTREWILLEWLTSKEFSKAKALSPSKVNSSQLSINSYFKAQKRRTAVILHYGSVPSPRNHPGSRLGVKDDLVGILSVLLCNRLMFPYNIYDQGFFRL